MGTGTTKANTAILHTGFDAFPGSLETRLLRRGYALLGEYAHRPGYRSSRPGRLLVAWTPEQAADPARDQDKARRNGSPTHPIGTRVGCTGGSRTSAPGALGALVIPGGRICPWTTPLAYATQALAAGAGCGCADRVTGIAAGRSTRSSPAPAWSAAAGW